MEDLSHSVYHAFFDLTPDLMAITDLENEQIVDVNQAFVAWSQYSRNELIGRTPAELGIGCDSASRKTILERLQNTGFVHDLEIEVRRRGGETRQIKYSGKMVETDTGKWVLSVARDVTDQKLADEQIAREREKLRTLSDKAPFGMVLVDRQGRFTYINQKFTDLFGYALCDIPDGRTWCRKAYPDAEYRHEVIAEWREDLGDANPGQKQNNIFTVVCNDGKRKIVEFIYTVLISGEGLMTCEDITELKRLENQLRQSQKLEALGTLAGGIAHDFNNILAGIIGFTEMVLEDMPFDARQNRRLEMALKGAYRGRDLVKQILAFSRHGEQDRKPLSLTQTVEDALAMLRPVFPSTVEIVWKKPAGYDQILGDPVQVQQVLTNLCTNAAYAMREQGGILEIGVSGTVVGPGQPAPVAEMKPGEYIVLTVSDTGGGMEPDTLGRIFDPFFTTKGKGDGTGLGLSVSHGIVESHGGYISVESEPGRGSTFSVYFPQLKEAAIIPHEEAPPLPRGSERILIVDDEDVLVELNRQRLTSLGYDVVATTSSIAALRIFREAPYNFDLVVTDQTMPHLTGTELAAELVKVKPDIPIILCTGHRGRVTPEQAQGSYFRSCIGKTVNKREMAEAIRRVLDEKAE